MYKPYPCPYYANMPISNPQGMHSPCGMNPCPHCANMTPYPAFNPFFANEEDTMEAVPIKLKDYGPKPFAVNIEEATLQNDNFRTALWTGKHMQLTLMSINPGEDIGLEIHPHLDQFLRLEEGEGIVKMGSRKDKLDFQQRVTKDFAIIIPAGTWHNLINTGRTPIKLYSIYAPPQHPFGTVHETKAAAEAAEAGHKR